MESSAQTSPEGLPRRGFFNALMDTRFNSLITPSLIRFVYILAMILIAIATLGMIIAGFAESPGTGILFLILAPLIGLLYLIVTRLWLELIVVIFKIRDAAEEVAVNTRRTGP
ncbi:MAG: DUF4282 domain-containing protein [Actinomycetota bacterium]|nr:DUF4282 domain-containing protein [Actinomycetota bacterium]